MSETVYHRMSREIGKVYIGEERVIRAVCAALFSGGHVLLEGVPGLAKTTLAKGLAQAAGAEFQRVQFTSDLMPADITGSSIYRIDKGEFKFIPGPIFTHVLLADEINRAPARSQSALLEAMQEQQVSVDGTTYPLKSPFFVIATQNGTDELGTFPLPESQLDRFMFRIRLGYPTAEQERRIIQQAAQPEPVVEPVLSVPEILEIRQTLEHVRVSDEMTQYISDLIRETRNDPAIERGASPRAGAMLLRAARGFAYLRQSAFLIPDDVLEALPLVLNHRLVLADDADDVDSVITRVTRRVRFK